jgi:hypothetical protein
MRNYYKSTAFVFALILLLTGTNLCQTYGKIFPNSEADRIFGNVSDSVNMPVTELQNLMAMTNNVLMFNLKDSNLVVLGDGRKLLYPPSATVDSTDVFEVYSKSIINDLLNEGKAAIVYVEKRKSVLTITCGHYTLEQGTDCPPWCP